MVVVPTSHDVTLTYGRSPADDVGQTITLVSVAAVVLSLVVDRGEGRRPGAARPGWPVGLAGPVGPGDDELAARDVPAVDRAVPRGGAARSTCSRSATGR